MIALSFNKLGNHATFRVILFSALWWWKGKGRREESLFDHISYIAQHSEQCIRGYNSVTQMLKGVGCFSLCVVCSRKPTNTWLYIQFLSPVSELRIRFGVWIHSEFGSLSRSHDDLKPISEGIHYGDSNGNWMRVCSAIYWWRSKNSPLSW